MKIDKTSETYKAYLRIKKTCPEVKLPAFIRRWLGRRRAK
jgi:hypothetical protein